jgi:hypothetical protein
MNSKRHRKADKGRDSASSVPSFLAEHSLSLTLAALLIFLFTLYERLDESTHMGAFLGNAVGDWLGVLAFVVATKYFFEVGSGESRAPKRHFHQRTAEFLLEHSLTIVLLLTGAVWAIAYMRTDADSKTGQLLGNVVADWSQVLGLVLITKYARERGSKEGD